MIAPAALALAAGPTAAQTAGLHERVEKRALYTMRNYLHDLVKALAK